MHYRKEAPERSIRVEKPKRIHRNVIWVGGSAVRKAEALMPLKLARDFKNNMKVICRYIIQKQKYKEL